LAPKKESSIWLQDEFKKNKVPLEIIEKIVFLDCLNSYVSRPYQRALGPLGSFRRKTSVEGIFKSHFLFLTSEEENVLSGMFQLVSDMTPDEIISLLDFGWLTDELTVTG
jgi:hypothetical protein